MSISRKPSEITELGSHGLCIIAMLIGIAQIITEKEPKRPCGGDIISPPSWAISRVGLGYCVSVMHCRHSSNNQRLGLSPWRLCYTYYWTRMLLLLLLFLSVAIVTAMWCRCRHPAYMTIGLGLLAERSERLCTHLLQVNNRVLCRKSLRRSEVQTPKSAPFPKCVFVLTPFRAASIVILIALPNVSNGDVHVYRLADTSWTLSINDIYATVHVEATNTRITYTHVHYLRVLHIKSAVSIHSADRPCNSANKTELWVHTVISVTHTGGRTVTLSLRNFLQYCSNGLWKQRFNFDN